MTEQQNQAALGIAGSALLLVADFLPWAETEVRGDTVTTNGFSTGNGGVAVILLAVAAAVVLWFFSSRAWLAIGFGALALLVAWADIKDTFSTDGAALGIGMWAMVGGGVFIILGASRVITVKPEHPDDE